MKYTVAKIGISEINYLYGLMLGDSDPGSIA